MPEITAYEKWPGVAAWQMDAVQAIFYAGRTWEEPTLEPVLQCADCSSNGAYFLDEALPERGSATNDDIVDEPIRYFEDRELQCQRDDIAQVRNVGTRDWRDVLDEMRARSDTYAKEFAAALERLI